MNRVLNQSRRYINTSSVIRPKRFYLVPYEEQYESRDNENEIRKKKLEFSIERQKQTKEFIDNYNPYSNIRSNVSENLDSTLKDYYQNKYKNKYKDH
tara:strand:- start:18 stop:308 length:291 start_codon:yes stop_codon:yes gene_type:complete